MIEHLTENNYHVPSELGLICSVPGPLPNPGHHRNGVAVDLWHFLGDLLLVVLLLLIFGLLLCVAGCGRAAVGGGGRVIVGCLLAFLAAAVVLLLLLRRALVFPFERGYREGPAVLSGPAKRGGPLSRVHNAHSLAFSTHSR